MLHTKLLKGYHDLIKLSSNVFNQNAMDQLFPYISSYIFGNKPPRFCSTSISMSEVINTKWLSKFQLTLLNEYKIDSAIFCADLNGKIPSWVITFKPEALPWSGYSLFSRYKFISSEIKSIENLDNYYLKKFQEHVSFRRRSGILFII